MRDWLYRNRKPILVAYGLVWVTLTGILQVLESTGHLP